MEKPKACHFHGTAIHPATHIMRLACPSCDDYRIVYTCESCTKSVQHYDEPQSRHITMTCSGCRNQVPVHERWRIIGKV